MSKISKILLLFIMLLSPFRVWASPSSSAYEHYLKGLLFEGKGAFKKALGEYQKTLFLDPEALIVYKSLALVAMHVGDFNLALITAEKAVALSPDDVDRRFLLGRLQIASGRAQEAKETFEAILELDPVHKDALLSLAKIAQSEDPPLAVPYYQDLMKVYPDLTEASRGMASVQESLGNMEEAGKVLKEAVDVNPENVEMLLSLAHHYEVERDTFSAAKIYERILEIEPRYTAVLLRLGELYYRSEQIELAEKVFLEALEIVPNDPMVNFYLALIADEKRDWVSAAIYMTVTAQVSHDPGTLLRLAFYLSQRGNAPEAVETLEKLYKRYPKEPDFAYYLALGYLDTDRWKKSVKLFKKVIRLKPNFAEVHFQLGMVLEQNGKFKKALPYLKETVRLQPENSVALNYLGYTLADKNMNLEEAEKLILRALENDPENGAYIDSISWVYYRQGRYQESEEELKRATALVSDSIVWEHYGDVQHVLGHTEQALSSYMKALEISPDKKKITQKIKSIGLRVIPGSEERKVLKEIERNFDKILDLSCFFNVHGTVRRRRFNLSGVIFYVRPDLFRLEVLGGPMQGPQMVIVHNSSGSLIEPRHLKKDISSVANSLAFIIKDFLSARLIRRLDSVKVTVRRKGRSYLYESEEIRAKILKGRNGGGLREIEFLSGPYLVDKSPVSLRFVEYDEIDGLMIPRELVWKSDAHHLRLDIQLQDFTLNSNVDNSIFETNHEDR